MIEIKGLSKQYGEKVIFRDLSLTLKDGEVLAILGHSTL